MFVRKHSALMLGAMLVAGGCQGQEDPAATKVIGGTVVTEGGGFMAGLTTLERDRTFCGGSFITAHIVVTAAHCVDNLDETLYVRPGIAAHGEAPKIPVTAVSVHPSYGGGEDESDVALLVLGDYDEASLPAPITPLQINSDGALPADGVDVTVFGRGNTTSFGFIFEDVVRQVTVPVVNLEQCRTSYPTVSDAEICASTFETGGYDSYQGDSGGPLILGDDVLVGVVSWGYGCAQAEKPGVYARVSTVASWIEAEIARLTTAPEEINAQTLVGLADSFCYTGFAQTATEAVSDLVFSEVTTGYTRHEWVPAEPVRDPAAIQTCDFAIPGGEETAFFQLVGTPDTGHGFLTGTSGHGFRTTTTPTTQNIEINCYDSLAMALDYQPQGFSYVGQGGQFFIFDQPYSGAIGDDAFILTCNVNDNAVSLIAQAGELGLEYLVQVRGPAFGEESGSIFSAYRWRQAPSVLAVGLTVGDDGTRGSFQFTNASEDDIFTWELSCNANFTLVDEFGARYPLVQGEDLNYRFRFVHPAHAKATVLRGATTTFTALFTETLPEEVVCEINGLETQVLVQR